ncbi:ATP-binding protein [Nodosilinea sp. P-1105]|uniref:ATP-binding protein n=1 Tax=Nodosilinea sp. P-1105 TaxID=2546229 RepID=UPI00146CB88F|nr:ATP-binding protein [Nodosilinea sp. P-1105]
MVAVSPPVSRQKWSTLSFVSTLYLHPVLDLLLAEVPQSWHAELRLGLQEALVNAAKHGNRLDPTKQVSVKYAVSGTFLWWVIADQGHGFNYPCSCDDTFPGECIFHAEDCGRGLYILYQVFDQVIWNQGGRELHLGKALKVPKRLPLIR